MVLVLSQREHWLLQGMLFMPICVTLSAAMQHRFANDNSVDLHPLEMDVSSQALSEKEHLSILGIGAKRPAMREEDCLTRSNPCNRFRPFFCARR